MKRTITISPISKMISTSMVEQGFVMGVAFLRRCRSLIVRNWNRQDSVLEHPEPLGYHPLERSGWPQYVSAPH